MNEQTTSQELSLIEELMWCETKEINAVLKEYTT